MLRRRFPEAGEKHFACTGVVIDTNKKKVLKTRELGFQAERANATKLPYADNSFRFALMFDVLEHMPDQRTAEPCFAEAFRVVREFVIVCGPSFDDEDALRTHDLKRCYADWAGHTFHHSSQQLRRMIQAVGPANFMLAGHERIASSFHPNVLPVSAPLNSSRYDDAVHAMKPVLEPRKNLFSRLVAVVAKIDAVDVYRLAFMASGAKLYSPVS